ncbi:MAG: efflux RND transporter periplasmic adaptor subunit, partial [Thermoanaerobaculia bacterium]
MKGSTILTLSLFLLLVAAVLAGCGSEAPEGAREAESDERTAPAGADPASSAAAELPADGYGPATRDALEGVLADYEELRALLAADRLESLDAGGRELAGRLRAAADTAESESGAAANLLDEAARTAESLAGAGDLETAREAFAELGRALIPVVGADDRLTAGWTVFQCPMVDGFARWMQPGEDPENPFMGPAMPACASPAEWTAPPPETPEEVEAHAEHAHGAEPGTGAGGPGGDEIAYYTCSMHPSVRSEDPGQCPICNMSLTPVTRAELETGTVIVDAARRQRIGVTTAPAERRELSGTMRAVGKVVYDETRLADVTVKYRGWIGRLEVDRPGQPVRRGQTLFTLYSPDLYATQEELLAALESQQAARGSAAPERADYLVEAAKKRLRLWDLETWQIDRIAETGEALKHVPIVSPASGVVVEKNVVAGAAVEPGQRLFRIAGIDRVWVEAEVYEAELPLVEEGQEVRVTFPYLPGREVTGRVAFVYPFLDDASRTGRVRVELDNPGLAIKPDMYANVLFERDGGEILAVPGDAVLYAGEREFVFVDLGEGRLQPRRLETGRRTGGWAEVLSGLEEGEVVV